MVELILNKNPKTALIRNDAGNIPLNLAVGLGFYSIVELIISKKRGSLISKKPDDGRTPLHYAIASNHYKIVELIIDKNRETLNQKDIEGARAIHYAASHGYYKIAKLIVDRNPNTTTYKDHNRATALHDAALEGAYKVAAVIIKADPSAINARNKNRQTPLDLAIEHNHLKVAGLLIMAGAKVKKSVGKGLAISKIAQQIILDYNTHAIGLLFNKEPIVLPSSVCAIISEYYGDDLLMTSSYKPVKGSETKLETLTPQDLLIIRLAVCKENVDRLFNAIESTLIKNKASQTKYSSESDLHVFELARAKTNAEILNVKKVACKILREVLDNLGDKSAEVACR